MTNAAQSVKTLIQDMAEDRKHYHVLNDLLIQQRDHIIARRAAELDVLKSWRATSTCRSTVSNVIACLNG